MSSTRRFYLYLVTLIALGIFAGGLGQLLSLIFDSTIRSSATQVGRQAFSIQQLSLGLAMVVIAGPLWFFFWRSIQSRVRGNIEEIGAGVRKFVLNLIQLGTSITVFVTAAEVLRFLISGAAVSRFPSGELSALIIVAIIWFYHWRVSEKEGHPSPVARTWRRWYVYILCGFGLVWLVEGVIQLVSAGILMLPFWQGTLVRANFWNYTTQMAVSHIVFGGIAWWFHWFRLAKGDFDSVLRQVYLYLVAISASGITALIALTVTLQRLLTLALGGVTTTMSQHFQFLGWAIPAMIVGAAVWAYHQQLVREEKEQVTEQRQSAERVQLYLMSFVGFGTMAAGLIMLFGILLNLAIGVSGKSITAGAGWWQSQVGLCIALLIVGAPLWLFFWSRVIKRVEVGEAAEWRAQSRRIFLYGIVGIGVVTLVADLVNIVYQILNGILQSRAGNILRESRWSLQTLIVAAPFLLYHWRILRADQKRGAEAVALQKQVILLTPDHSGAQAKQLETAIGYRVRVYQRLIAGEEPPALPDEELARAAQEIGTAPGKKAMVVSLGGKLIVLPYQEK